MSLLLLYQLNLQEPTRVEVTLTETVVTNIDLTEDP